MFDDVAEVKFHDTYYYASVIDHILQNRWGYLQQLESFYGDDLQLRFSVPFPKYSALHSFSEFVIRSELRAEFDRIDLPRRQACLRNYENIPAALNDLRPTTLPVELAFEAYRIVHAPFETWLVEQGTTFGSAIQEDIDRYYDDLQLGDAFDELIGHLVADVFFILFPNRSLMMLLNQLLADQLRNTYTSVGDEEHEFFASPGILKRQRVPDWAKRAIRYRDRGMCALCNRDLSGLVRTRDKPALDHIVPLSKGGLNDVTNMQLLCRDCNLRKASGQSLTSDYYEVWY